MRQNLENATIILEAVDKILKMDEPNDTKLQRLWVTLAYYKAMSLSNALVAYLGPRVVDGPFKGMKLTSEALKAGHSPALLGHYEYEFHPAIESFVKHPYKHILNIGCSYGYYAVGFALRMPNTAIHAFDIDDSAKEKCRAMAELNEVSNRITIGDRFRPEDFASYTKGDTLAIVDIEGGEVDLLDPVRYPALQKIDIMVELHDVFDPTISTTIHERFKTTHDIEILPKKTTLFDFKTIFAGNVHVDPFDELIAHWENRDGPTPGAVMRVKNK